MSSKGHVVALLLLNLCAHFIPFERAGSQPDDYFHAAFSRGLVADQPASLDFSSYDRPLHRTLSLSLNRALGVETPWQLPLVLAGSSLLLLVVYLFLAELLGDPASALQAGALFCLLPNKLELYGTRLYALYNAFLALFVLSAWLYLRFLRAGPRRLLVGAVAVYAAAIGCHELGFFLPLALLALARPRSPQALRSLGWFAVPAGLYGLVRLAALSGALPGAASREIEWGVVATNVFYAVPSHYLGRYFARAVAYGVGGVLEMSRPWLVCALAADVVLVAWASGGLRDAAPRRQPSPARLLLAAAALIAPACLHSVQGRHTVLASVPLCALAAAYGLPRTSRAARAGALAALLLISQGDAWHNVVAGRIARAIFSSLEQRRAEIAAAPRVLFDGRSFADAIAYTWGERDRNVLHYYFGVPVLGSWGLEAMVALASQRARPAVVACGSAPREEGRYWTCREHFAPPGPERTLRVPREGTLVWRFGDVYPRGFDPRSGRP